MEYVHKRIYMRSYRWSGSGIHCFDYFSVLGRQKEKVKKDIKKEGALSFVDLRVESS